MLLHNLHNQFDHNDHNSFTQTIIPCIEIVLCITTNIDDFLRMAYSYRNAVKHPLARGNLSLPKERREICEITKK